MKVWVYVDEDDGPWCSTQVYLKRENAIEAMLDTLSQDDDEAELEGDADWKIVLKEAREFITQSKPTDTLAVDCGAPHHMKLDHCVVYE